MGLPALPNLPERADSGLVGGTPAPVSSNPMTVWPAGAPGNLAPVTALDVDPVELGGADDRATSGAVVDVLVVDPDPETGDLVTHSRAGLAVSRVDDAYVALARMRSHAPDIVVAEVFLPGVGGWELLARMEELGITCPAVLYTHSASAARRAVGLGSSAVVAIVPKRSPALLRAAVDLALDAAARPRGLRAVS
jgi:CheY-like chemotaxis protein